MELAPVTVVVAGVIRVIFPVAAADMVLAFPFETLIENVFGLLFLAKVKLDGAVSEHGIGVGAGVAPGLGCGVGVAFGDEDGVGVTTGVA